MRVAALYDIHGNLPALEAVLAEIEQARFDLIVIGGSGMERLLSLRPSGSPHLSLRKELLMRLSLKDSAVFQKRSPGGCRPWG